MISEMKETSAYATVSLKYWTFYAIILHMKIRIALLLINNRNHVSLKKYYCCHFLIHSNTFKRWVKEIDQG